MDEKIRVLFLAANPINAGRLRLDEEAREIQQKLASGTYRETFELISQFATRPNDLQLALLKHRPHIVHFSGHGKGPQGILLQDNSGKSKLVSLSALSTLFRIRKDNTRVVIFNACYSKPQAGAFSEIVDYTIGTTNMIGDRAAIAFAASFYRALAFGLSVTDGFELAKNELALNAIRNTGSPKLFIRAGVDPSIPLVTEIVGPINKEMSAPPPSLTQVKAKVERLSEGVATSKDAKIIQHAVISGNIVLEQTEQLVRSRSKKRRKQSSQDESEGLRIGTLVDVRSAKAERSRNTVSSTNPLPDNSMDLELGSTEYERVQENVFPSPPGLAPPLPSLIFVGREQALSDVKKVLRLNEEPASTDRKMVVIRGWPGVGKTAFVSILAHDPQVLEAFPDGVLWTSLGRNPELLTKMAEWGRALGTDEILRAPTLENAVTRLGLMLQHRRMLLIADDVSEPQHANLFLSAAGSGCAFTATTRLPSVAEALTTNPSEIYVLPVLTEGDAIQLLRYFAPSLVENHLDECRMLVQELGCLPLALQLAGRLLRSQEDSGLSVADLLAGIQSAGKSVDQSAPVDRSEQWLLPSVHALFKVSTDELDEATRDCFAALAAFAPKPATFDAAAMRAVWQADDPRPIIRKLVGHGLLEPTGNSRFQMHPLLVLHARSLLE